ncbi:MAG: rod shape determining protein RodA [Saprospiraceae bacterium]|jgi:rod shape determining protein RodA
MGSSRKNIIYNIDWVIVLVFLALVFFGVTNIYAADYNPDYDFFDLSRRSGKQFMWIGISVLVAFVIMLIDSRFIYNMAFPLYMVMLLLQVFVFLFAKEVNGARAWLEIGPFKVQPAEFCKFAAALALAVYLSKINIRIKKEPTSIHNLGVFFFKMFRGKKVWSFSDLSLEQHVIPFAIIFSPVVLILLQQDTGTAIVFFTLFFVLFREGIIGNSMYLALIVIFITILTLMLGKAATITILGFVGFVFYAAFIKKTQKAMLSIAFMIVFLVFRNVFNLNPAVDTYVVLSWIAFSFIQNYFRIEAWKRVEKIVVLGALLLSIGFVYSVNTFYDILQPHQRVRVDVILGKVQDRTIGFQTEQSMNAIGSGGFFGKGFLNGALTKGNWVPEQSTDYIFSTVGEEWGFVGAFSVISLFIFLILRILYQAEKQRNSAYRIYGYGVASIFFFHLLVNIGMTIQVMPVIGIPLPFFSYGGSSLLSFTVLLFLFLKFDSQRLEGL